MISTTQIVSILDYKPEDMMALLIYLSENEDMVIKEAMSDWFENEYTVEDDDEAIVALMIHTGDNFEECKDFIEEGDYLVLTDSEADDAWDESLNNYIDECVLPELSGKYTSYFDREKFIEDCKADGRGHSLSSYDGNEYSVSICDTEYYIYRIN